MENSKTPFIYYFLTFLFVVSLRNFFDTITDTTVSLETKFSIGLYKITLENLLSNTFWYLGIALFLIIIVHIFTKEDVKKIGKVIFPSFLVLLSVSFFDSLLSLGIGFNQMYMLPGIHDQIFLRWLTFSIPFESIGVTVGMKIESFIIIFLIFSYVFIKKQSLIRSILSSYIVYSAIFFWGCMPFLIQFVLTQLGEEYLLTSNLILNFVLSFLLLFGFIVYYFFNKNYMKSIIKDMDPFRIAHYLLMLALGIALGIFMANEPITLTSNILFKLIFAPTAIVFAGMFALVINGLADIKIDQISNPQRSLVDGTIPFDHFIHIGIISFFLAILYSLAIDHITFLIIFLIMGDYFLYSAPPLRLKRVLFFSKFWIALNSFILVILGYYFISGRTDLPWEITVAFLGGFTILINFIDLKDYEGDKKEGIKTIPTVIGLKKSKILIGLIFLFGFTAFGVALQNLLLLVIFIVAGIIQVFLTIRDNYKESYVFSVYLIILITVIYFILTKNVIIPGLS